LAPAALPGTTPGGRRRLTLPAFLLGTGALVAAAALAMLTRPYGTPPVEPSGAEPASAAMAAPIPPTAVESARVPGTADAPPSVLTSAPPAPPSVVPVPAPMTAAIPPTSPSPASPAAAKRRDAEIRQAPAPDGRAKATAAELDAAIDACRCLAAQRLLGVLKGLPGGQALAASRAARIGACRPVDVDHKCVHGRLVGVE